MAAWHEAALGLRAVPKHRTAPSDVVRMAWSHITADNKIVVVQQKTGRRLLIPLHRDLLTALSSSKA